MNKVERARYLFFHTFDFGRLFKFRKAVSFLFGSLSYEKGEFTD